MKLITLFMILFTIVSSSLQHAIIDDERTVIIIKPDGVQRGIVGEIIKRYETKGLKLIAMKMVQPSRAFMEVHYLDMKGRPFYDDVLDYMISGPVVATVWQGYKAIAYGRQLIGRSTILKSSPGTIRADYGISDIQNTIHGSDSVDAAEREIRLWFNETELYPKTMTNAQFLHTFDD